MKKVLAGLFCAAAWSALAFDYPYPTGKNLDSEDCSEVLADLSPDVEFAGLIDAKKHLPSAQPPPPVQSLEALRMRLRAAARPTEAAVVPDKKSKAKPKVLTPDEQTAVEIISALEALTDDTEPGAQKAQRYAQNFFTLLYGTQRRATVYAEDRDVLARLRNPLVEIATPQNGELRTPASIQTRAKLIVNRYIDEGAMLQPQVEMLIGQLGKQSYSPRWANSLVSAYVAMDRERTFSRDTRAEMSHLTRLQQKSSVAYIKLHDTQRSLGVAQDRLIVSLRRFLFNLIAFNTTETATWSYLNLWKSELDPKRDSISKLSTNGQIDPHVESLVTAHNNALLEALEELMALIVIPEKLPMSIESRIVLKSFVDAVQDLSWDIEQKQKGNIEPAPLTEEAQWGVRAEDEEAKFSRFHLGHEVEFNGEEYRATLTDTFKQYLSSLMGDPVLTHQMRYFSENLGRALYDLRHNEITVQQDREDYASCMNAATAAASSINRVTRPYTSDALEADSIQMDGWIQDLNAFPELREMGLRMIKLRGAFHDPLRGQFVNLPDGVDPREFMRRFPSVRKDQLIASQFFSNDRIQSTCLFAQIFYYRGERDYLRSLVSQRTWKTIADATEAGSNAAIAKTTQNASKILGEGSVTAAAIEQAQKNMEEAREKNKQPAPITERISEQPLPHATHFVPILMSVWDENILGPKPSLAAMKAYEEYLAAKAPKEKPKDGEEEKNADPARPVFETPHTDSLQVKAYYDRMREAIESTDQTRFPPIPPDALTDSFTLLSSILARLDALAWRVHQTNIRAQDELFAGLTINDVNPEKENELRKYAWDEYHKILADADAMSIQVRETFYRVRRAVQTAFKDRASNYESLNLQGKEAKDLRAVPLSPTVPSRDLENQVLAADATLIRDVAPYEALTWLLLKTRNTTQQFFLSELLFYVVQQSYGLHRSEITESNLALGPTVQQSRRRIFIYGGVLLGAIALNQVADRFIHWIWPTPAPAPAVTAPADPGDEKEADKTEDTDGKSTSDADGKDVTDEQRRRSL